ncbi:hypothetical protein SODALDRAFT_353702 [Sodiomyces alkalinus F11]|uniref:N-acetyltransferase domain-containing protein n=1 Tax=Sodiomyces alkalinus (strain CBS 110278 / VKM F-3762 / F11) TaxID=1314773 RepID=A0A3N2PJM3_SODAK|nr:hypothetical protein SODALDRAFT_353702 [Sodiomyces alkalinus F11]ROT34723.1 hypothetical protein SODALDRAFT_353702 [Sodiomyces alkalinus F11]
MSVPPSPTTSKPFQLSIKSFFQPRRPEYTPPPSQQHRPAETTPSRVPEPPPQSDPGPVHAPTAAPVPVPVPDTATATAPAAGPDPSPHPLPSIPPEAAIRPLAPDDIQPLKRLNGLLLPVTYPEAFYTTALTSTFSRVITWADPIPKVVGGIICRVEPFINKDGSYEQALYIQSLALLSPYRAHGLATAALADLLRAAAAAATNHSSSTPSIRLVYAHVWTENDDGLRWYAARGFIRDPHPQEHYYFKLRPDTAYIVRRDISPLSSSPSPPLRMGNNASTPSAPAGAAGIPPSATASAANLPPISGPPTSRAASSLSSPSSSSLPPAPPPPPLSSQQERQQVRPTLSTSSSLTKTHSAQGESFQNKRAETEWNDLPLDMVTPNGLLAPHTSGTNGNVSEASSMSSSTTTRKKKERRAYPSAAFGN